MNGEQITTKSGHTALWVISPQAYLPELWHDENLALWVVLIQGKGQHYANVLLLNPVVFRGITGES